MKSESDIAREYIKQFMDAKGKNRDLFILATNWASIHKETCQRFLEFLEQIDIACNFHLNNCESPPCVIYKKEIIDLKKAIKLYEEVGI